MVALPFLVGSVTIAGSHSATPSAVPTEATRSGRCWLLYYSLTRHPFPTAVSQLFHVVHWRGAEEPLVLAGEVRGVAVPHAVTSTRGIQSFAKHQAARLLQPELLLELQGAHCRERSKVMVET